MDSGALPPRASWIALGVAAAVLAGSIGYASFRDKGPRETEAVTNLQAPDTIEALEARTRAAPNDATSWAALGMAHFEREDFAQAVPALEHATRLEPGKASLWSVLGEARVKASERDPMPPAALEAFRKALAIDPKDPPARYFMAVHKDLGGDHKGAIDDWLALLADTPAGAPWEADLRRTIEQVGKLHDIEVASRMKPAAGAGAAMPGPDADQLRAASKLAPSEQDQMARGMVERLEQRLAADPANVDGWIMLMRSRMTLGEPARASAALKSAVAANPGAKARLENEARGLGVPQ